MYFYTGIAAIEILGWEPIPYTGRKFLQNQHCIQFQATFTRPINYIATSIMYIYNKQYRGYGNIDSPLHELSFVKLQ